MNVRKEATHAALIHIAPTHSAHTIVHATLAMKEPAMHVQV